MTGIGSAEHEGEKFTFFQQSSWELENIEHVQRGHEATISTEINGEEYTTKLLLLTLNNREFEKTVGDLEMRLNRSAIKQAENKEFNLESEPFRMVKKRVYIEPFSVLNNNYYPEQADITYRKNHEKLSESNAEKTWVEGYVEDLFMDFRNTLDSEISRLRDEFRFRTDIIKKNVSNNFERIESLREENEKLREENSELESNVTELQGEIDDLKDRFENHNHDERYPVLGHSTDQEGNGR